jgi:membrane-associated phospholipid phosphatase
MVDLTRPWPPGLSRSRLLAFVAAVLVLLFAIHPADAAVRAWARTLPDGFRGFMLWLTDFGDAGWILIPSFVLWLVCIAFARLMRRSLTVRTALGEMASLFGFMLLGVGLPSLAAALLKRAIGRARPRLFETEGLLSFRPNWLEASYQAFPSGHAATIMAFATVVAFLAPRWFWPAMSFGVAVASSRVFIGAHYLTDMLGGMVLGVLGAYAVRNAFALKRWAFEPMGDRIVLRPVVAVPRLMRKRSASRRPVPGTA